MQYRIIFCLVVVVVLLVGTVSADTMILGVYHDAYMTQTSTSATWQTLRDGSGTSASDDYPDGYLLRTISHASKDDRYIQMVRYAYVFNTSLIGSSSTISSATFRTKFYSLLTTLLGQNETAIVIGSPTNPLNFVAEDYNNLNLSAGLPNEIVTRYDFTNQGAGNVNFTLNSGGLLQLNKSGLTTFYTLDGDELDNSFTGVWDISKTRSMTVVEANDAVSVNRPYLEVVYSSGATPPAASFTTSKNYIRIPNTVTATDTSTNTPTSWQWSWGDGTANSTTQNPTHQYTKRGKYDIYLTATNAGGSGTTATATSVKVVGYENYY
jgi:PKD repeat protein